MNINFATMCLLVVLTTLGTSMFVAPILWDAAGTIELILNSIHTPEWGGSYSQ